MNSLRSWTLGLGLLTTVVVGGFGVTSAFAATASNSVTVQPGNTFWTIARSYGVSVQALEGANPSVNPNDLLVGTILTLPSTAADGQANSQLRPLPSPCSREIPYGSLHKHMECRSKPSSPRIRP